jgi:hypothetical protein
MDQKELVTVFTVSDPIKAEIIKNALSGEGIPCFIEEGNQAGAAGLMGIEIKLQVPAGEASRAARFIEDHEKEHHGEEPADEEGMGEEFV